MNQRSSLSSAIFSCATHRAGKLLGMHTKKKPEPSSSHMMHRLRSFKQKVSICATYALKQVPNSDVVSDHIRACLVAYAASNGG